MTCDTYCLRTDNLESIYFTCSHAYYNYSRAGHRRHDSYLHGRRAYKFTLWTQAQLLQRLLQIGTTEHLARHWCHQRKTPVTLLQQ